MGSRTAKTASNLVSEKTGFNKNSLHDAKMKKANKEKRKKILKQILRKNDKLANDRQADQSNMAWNGLA